MKRLVASILALSLTAAAGTALAQSPSNSNASSSKYSNDRYVQNDAPYYDYARVIRVDPVLQQPSYRNTSSSQSRRCWTEEGQYSDNDRRDDRYDGRDDDGYYSSRDDDRYYGRGDDGYYGRDRGYGNGNSAYGTETGRNVATVLGGIVGAALGSKMGGGSGRYITAAVGSTVGGLAGRGIYENVQRNRHPKLARVTVCDPVRTSDDRSYEERSVTAYDVTYEYAGHQHTTRTNYHPGDRMRIRVDVQPQ